MKGVIVPTQGAAPTIVDDLTVPEPGDNQILVKSIYTAINPVDPFMAQTGILVLSWPLVLGCDASGTITALGRNASQSSSIPGHTLKVGDRVFGCTRLGDRSYATCQEYFLMDTALTLPTPANLSLASAATLGVSAYTACLGVFAGLCIPLPADLSSDALSNHGKGEWIVVLGGASSVGKSAVQILAALGYRVLASCSRGNSDLLHSLGATATLDYTLPHSEQIASITNTTGPENPCTRIFDAVASNTAFAAALLNSTSTAYTSHPHPQQQKYFFSTTNDWAPPQPADFPANTTLYAIALGPLGRDEHLDALMRGYIPLIYHLVEGGALMGAEAVVFGEEDGEEAWESVVRAYEYQGSGRAGARKVVVRVGEE